MAIKQPLEIEVKGLAKGGTSEENGSENSKTLRISKCVRLLKSGSYAIQVLILYKSVIKHPLTNEVFEV